MLKTKVGYSNNKDAYEAGRETAKMAVEELNPKVGLLFNSVGYDQKKLLEGIKEVMPDIDIVGCTSSAGIITPEGGYMIDEDGTAGMLVLDDEELTVACYGMAKKGSARETGRMVAQKALEKAGIDYWCCSECHKTRSEYYAKPKDNFCPNCGAKMKGGADNEHL